MLVASSCVELKTEVLALWDWGNTISLSLPFPSLDCTKTPELHEYDITFLLDPKLRWIYDRRTVCGQGNCMNNVLLMHRWTKRLRTTNEVEFKFYLNNSNYCRELKTDDPLKPGDILTIHQYDPDCGEATIVHGATVINRLICEKESMITTHTCRLVSMDSTLASYGVVPRCDRSENPETMCRMFTRYYRCQSGLQHAPVTDQRIYTLLDQLEFNLENIEVWGNAPLSYSKMTEVFSELDGRLFSAP